MARVTASPKSATPTSAIMLRCAECKSAGVSEARKFPAGLVVGVTVVCPRCAAIAVVEGGQCRPLRTHEWVNVVMEPSGFDLLAARLATAKRIGLATE